MKWMAFVTTCPREDSTLQRTVLSLAEAGWPAPDVLYDTQMSGARNNLLRALDLGRRRGEWDRLLVAQDDVLFVPGLREWVDEQHAVGWLPSGLVNLWLPEYHQNKGHAGWWRLPDEDMPKRAYGALAYVFDPPLVDALLEVANFNKQPNRCEYFVATVCKQRHFGYWYYERSLCQRTPHLDHLVMDAVPEVLSPSGA